MIFYGLILLAVSVGLFFIERRITVKSLEVLEEKLKSTREGCADMTLRLQNGFNESISAVCNRVDEIDEGRKKAEKEIFGQLETLNKTTDSAYCELRKDKDAADERMGAFEVRLAEMKEAETQMLECIDEKAREIGESIANQRIQEYRKGFENDIQSILSYSPSPKKRNKAKRGS